MSARVLVVSGTGTNVGKTYVACAMARALRAHVEVCGLKPFESGFSTVFGDDQVALAQSSTRSPADLGFATRCFSAPLAPSEAAHRAGESVSAALFVEQFIALRERFSGVVVLELAGGLFSPFDDGLSNADVVTRIGAHAHFLVAVNRLGVIHDVRATRLAATGMGLTFDGLVLTQMQEQREESALGNARILSPLFPDNTHALPFAGGSVATAFFASLVRDGRLPYR